MEAAVIGRSFTTTGRFCIVAALLVPPAAIAAQLTSAAPADAAGTSTLVLGWGDNSSGELGDGVLGVSSATPVVVSLPSGVTPTAISAAQGVGYAIGSDGKLYAWGDNTY